MYRFTLSRFTLCSYDLDVRCRYSVAIKCLDYVYAEAFCLLAALLLTGVALRCLMRGSDVGVELARIVQANASELPDAATLTLACWPKPGALGGHTRTYPRWEQSEDRGRGQFPVFRRSERRYRPCCPEHRNNKRQCARSPCLGPSAHCSIRYEGGCYATYISSTRL